MFMTLFQGFSSCRQSDVLLWLPRFSCQSPGQTLCPAFCPEAAGPEHTHAAAGGGARGPRVRGGPRREATLQACEHAWMATGRAQAHGRAARVPGPCPLRPQNPPRARPQSDPGLCSELGEVPVPRSEQRQGQTAAASGFVARALSPLPPSAPARPPARPSLPAGAPGAQGRTSCPVLPVCFCRSPTPALRPPRLSSAHVTASSVCFLSLVPPRHTHTRTKAPGSALSPSGLHPASWTLSHPPPLLPLCQADGHVQSGSHPRPRRGRSAWASAWASGRRRLTGQRSCTGSVPESGAGRCGRSDPRLSPLCGPAVPVIRPLHSPGLQPRPLGSAAGHAGPAPWPLRTHAVGWRQSASALTPGQQGPSSARWPPCRSVQLPRPPPPQSPAPPPPLHGPPTWRREARPVLPSSGAAQLPSKATVHVCPAFSPLPKSPHALPCGPHAPASSPIPHARDTLS